MVSKLNQTCLHLGKLWSVVEPEAYLGFFVSWFEYLNPSLNKIHVLKELKLSFKRVMEHNFVLYFDHFFQSLAAVFVSSQGMRAKPDSVVLHHADSQLLEEWHVKDP